MIKILLAIFSFFIFHFSFLIFSASPISAACSPPSDYTSCSVAFTGPFIAANPNSANYQQIRERYNAADPGIQNQMIPVTVILTTRDTANLSWLLQNFQAMQHYGLQPIIRIASSSLGASGWGRISISEAQTAAQTLNQAFSQVGFPQKPIVYFGNEPNLPNEWGGQADANSFSQAFAAFILAAGGNPSFQIFVPPMAGHQGGAEYNFVRQILNYRMSDGRTIAQAVNGAALTVYEGSAGAMSGLFGEMKGVYGAFGIGNFAIVELGPYVNGGLVTDRNQWIQIMSGVFREIKANPGLFSGAQYITTAFFLPDRVLLVVIDANGNVTLMELAALGGGSFGLAPGPSGPSICAPPPGGGPAGGPNPNLTCNKIVLNVSPNPAEVGDSVKFEIKEGDATTWISDCWSGGVDCSGSFPFSKTCNATEGGIYTWTHEWRHCDGNIENCSDVCSETATFAIGQTTPPCQTDPKFAGLVGNDCTCPVNGPLSYVPMEGPTARVVFPGVGNYVDPPPGITCDTDPNFNKGEWVTVPWQVTFNVKDVKSVFAKYISDSLEGDFQAPEGNAGANQEHRYANFNLLSPSDQNNYFGPAQKLAPKILLNQEFSALSGLRIKFIRYVLEKPNRQDAQFPYTDIYGQGPPLTVGQMFTLWGFPDPPTESSSEWAKQFWQYTWGRYWDKIPLAANDKAAGKLGAGAFMLDSAGNPQTNCARPTMDIIVPEFYRTNTLSAFINQILLPKAAQSPLTYQSEDWTKEETLASACNLNSSQKPLISLKDVPITLVASSDKSSSSQENGEVLADLSVNHDLLCQVPQAEPGDGDGLCLPKQITVKSTPKAIPYENSDGNDTVFVCANKVCPGGSPGACDLNGKTDSACVAEEPTRESFTCSCTPPPPTNWWCFCDPAVYAGCNPTAPDCQSTCNWNSTGRSYDASCCYLTPGTKTVDIPISMTMLMPYLESVWNKSTSYRDNKQSGYEAFFAPAMDTGVILNQSTYEKHGESPNLQFSGSGVNAAFIPPGSPKAFPDFVAGAKNAIGWTLNSLWPF